MVSLHLQGEYRRRLSGYGAEKVDESGWADLSWGPSTLAMKENSGSDNTLVKEEELRELEVPIQKLKK